MSRKAFTMIEIVLVFVICGIMAGVGIPSFIKTITRTQARDARNNLIIIHTAQASYKAQNNSYLTAGDLAAMNNAVTGLKLNLVATGGTVYVCAPPTCTATASAGADVFEVT